MESFFYKINFSIYINQDISFASDVLVLYCLFIVIMQIEVDQNKFKGAADVVALWRKCDGRKDLKMWEKEVVSYRDVPCLSGALRVTNSVTSCLGRWPFRRTAAWWSRGPPPRWTGSSRQGRCCLQKTQLHYSQLCPILTQKAWVTYGCKLLRKQDKNVNISNGFH